jgi:hypothetical protein
VTGGEAAVSIVVGMLLLGVVIRLAVAPLLAELRALRVDVASGLALDRARRSSEEVPAP